MVAIGALPAGASAATISITSGADENASGNAVCVLREAIREANADDDGLYPECTWSAPPSGADAITLTTPVSLDESAGGPEDAALEGDLDITETLTITGSDTPDPSISQDAAPDERVLEVPVGSGTNLTLNSLVVEDGSELGSTPEGGNIRFDGDTADELTLNDVVVRDGVADGVGVSVAGGIYVQDSALTIENGSLISQNRSGGVANGIGGGLTIRNGPLTVSGSSVSDNDAGINVGALAGGFGAGVYAQDGAIELENAVIDDNQAGGGTSSGTSEGGGMYVVDTDLGMPPHTSLTADDSSISGNSAGGDSGGGNGGALNFQGTTATFDNVDVDDNLAGGKLGSANGVGAGIYSLRGLTIQNGSSFSGNQAGVNPSSLGGGGDGGAIFFAANPSGNLEIDDSTISNNQAGEDGGNGGAIEIIGSGSHTISDSVLADNRAGTTAGMNQGIGGAILYNSVGQTGTSMSIDRTTVSGNDAAGRGLNQVRGGGIHSQTRGTFTITDSTISGNDATNNNNLAFGGGLSLESEGDPGTYLISNTTISGNIANSDNAMPTGGFGGGIAAGQMSPIAEAPTVNLTHSTIASNAAQLGSMAGSGAGGNLYANNTGTMDWFNSRASIFADGTGAVGQENCRFISADTIDSQGENVEATTPTQCDLGATGDQIGVNPLLGILANNGGPTETMALGQGSPAIDSVPSGGLCPGADQRGVNRPQGSSCDAGAYERRDTDGDGLADESDNCPSVAGPASNAGCPLTATATTTGENPECEPLRQKISRFSRKIRQAEDPEQKAKLRKKRRNARKQLAALGCAP